LLLASLVIVSHSWPLSGREPEPAIGGANLGTWAVFGFFAISGFLITRSRLNGHPAIDFYRARVLRIFPAFLVALLVVAFAFVPLSLLFDPAADWHPLSSVTFVVRNLPLYPPLLGQPGIVDTLATVPFAFLWNGSLWTLFWEACCYLLIGIGVSVLSRRVLPVAVLVLFVLLTILSVAGAFGLVPMPDLAGRVIPMVIAFLGGAALFLYGARVPQGVIGALVAVGLLVVIVVLGLVPQFGTLPLGYLLLVLGNTMPLSRVGSKFDISYGVYIYAWPVQQLIALAFGPALPLPLFILFAFAGTVPLAFLSSLLVERPALSLKSRRTAELPSDAPFP
jgi:peptidoglycan/LPS O-acetylase OafA/YrhL